MSNRNYQGIVQTLNVQPRVIVGSFAPNGSSAVDATSRLGLGFSVARASAGVFTITFTDPFPNLLAVTASLQLNAADDKFVQVGAYSAADKTLTLTVWDISGAAATDVAANANNRINFVAWFQDSTVTPVYGA